VDSPDGPVILFPPYDNSGALAFLQAINFRYDHSLWRLQLDPNRPAELPIFPSDLTLTGYEDSDLRPYVDLINSAFLDHPVPLHVTSEQIEHIHASPSFDPAEIALIRTADGAMVGFSVASVDRKHDPPTGTINLLGVRREFRGRGLGRFLLIKGIERLQSLDVEQIELAVEAENEQAMRLYRSVGFEPVEEWQQWMRRAE
jgi:mycothiol synthase